MASAMLNLVVVVKRMLSKAEAAQHCGRPVKRFEVECPVTPVRFPNGDERFDVRDLDAWIDDLKGAGEDDAEAIVARLG